ncbi:MAG TPA: cytochrome C oxidase subunit IV family protein [Anaerolineales bacterium]|nr:cytochrome C oxidase subunit IV family protein [Anaerolineales bacterium]
MADNKDQGSSSRRAELGAGVWVFLMLGVLTFGEFIVGVIASPWGSALLLVAAFKAFFVIVYYMHVGRLFTTDGDGH